MKRQITISLFLLSLFLVAYTPKDKGKVDESGFSVKNIDKSLAKITDSLYAGKYEVTNLQYHYWGFDIMKNKNTELYKIHLPDSSNWGDKSEYNEPLVDYYFRNLVYQNYPVVNISYEAATLFCKWLTEKYNADPKRTYKKVLFRLPTEKEWERAAKGGNDISIFPWGDRLIQNDKYMCKYNVIGDENIKYDSLTSKFVIDSKGSNDISHADMPVPVASYFPNSFGLYNVCGNVGEMVQEKGLSCGGSWKSPGGDVKIISKAHYTKSLSDLGFRYFMEIIEK